MIFKKFTKFLPLSVTAYGILFILFGLLLFGSFGWLAVTQLFALQRETEFRNVQLAKEELQHTVTEVLAEGRKVANSFANWDETIQQLGNSTYYSYWREYRVPSASFVPDYFSAVELYDRNGVALAAAEGEEMPVKMSLPFTTVKLVKKHGNDKLYYSYPLSYDYKSDEIAGYIVVQFDFIKAITGMQRFKYADVRTVAVDIAEGTEISESQIAHHLNADVIPNVEFNQLQDLMYKTLSQFGFVGVSLALLLLYLLVQIFGLPSRRLSHHIDALRQGDVESLRHSDKNKLAVAEFEKVRLSLNDYQTQLDHRDAALRESEMRMRAVLDNVVDGIVTIDEHGTIESCNPAVQCIFGLGGNDIAGQNITSLFAESSLEEFYNHCGRGLRYQVDALQANGACELVGKRLDGAEFPIEIALSGMRVAGMQLFIAVVRDITERKRAEERLVYLANYDELTGLPNRTLFRDRLHQAVAHAKRENRLVAVLFFDLDHFKKINDTLGHHVGDQLLVGAAARLTSSVRELDTVARLGGDEFMVILESIKHVDEVTDIVTNLLEALEKPFMLEGQEAFIAASAGIAIYPFDDVEINNLVKNADTAMFRAKEQGGNTYQYFKSDMNTKAVERLKLESALRHALERNEFELYYQPRVDLYTGAINGMEALLRWNNPQLGAVSPLTFIPLLEETGLIVPVGDWVLKTACEQTRVWHEAGYSQLKVSVNLSARQFRQKDLVNRFKTIWEASGLVPAYLELEITEGLLVDNVDTVVDILGEFYTHGVQISIDDFGTGYSSLSYLKRFPIHTLKIDRSFVRDIIDDPDDAAITAAIVALARSLRLNIIAEGVETKSQLDYLTSLSCDEVQGFYFSKPLPAHEFEAFMSAQRQKADRDLLGAIMLKN
ncbi:MAG: EAL domain-containing protein [Gammaproteobacteria bacterium]|jgi:diguanylate cyclase (GGDEF)-like protein/PAS domain S-box-containing protein